MTEKLTLHVACIYIYTFNLKILFLNNEKSLILTNDSNDDNIYIELLTICFYDKRNVEMLSCIFIYFVNLFIVCIYKAR